MDRLIALMQARERGDLVEPITPKWPYSEIDRWMAQIIEEMAEEGRA